MQGPPQGVLGLEALEQAGPDGGVEHLDAGSAALLGPVHGHVGVAQHVLGPPAVGHVGHADAGRDDGLAAVQGERCLDGVGDPLGDDEHLVDVHVLAHDDELVPGQPADGVAWADGAPQALTDPHEDLVADRVAERVVTTLNRSRSTNSTPVVRCSRC